MRKEELSQFADVMAERERPWVSDDAEIRVRDEVESAMVYASAWARVTVKLQVSVDVDRMLSALSRTYPMLTGDQVDEIASKAVIKHRKSGRH